MEPALQKWLFMHTAVVSSTADEGIATLQHEVCRLAVVSRALCLSQFTVHPIVDLSLLLPHECFVLACGNFRCDGLSETRAEVLELENATSSSREAVHASIPA